MKKVTIIFWVILSLFLIALFISPFSAQKIYLLLSRTSLYNTIDLKYKHTHETDEAKELVYFENEFVNQPYANPMDSSIELIQLSLSLTVLSLLVIQFRKVSR
ncbi:MAG: hypothetical protein RMJ36_01820 [Candidatus Calescibacterium sp.]|nr:hypothetical protein [Candidatus Calescibacterium sp.]MDW8132376.1 hypothetical protein [Candidatus Calescibacterium sp.]